MSTDGIAVEIGNVYVVVGFPTFVPKRRTPSQRVRPSRCKSSKLKTSGSDLTSQCCTGNEVMK
jgi:hypothetical protein